jgi:hypothetical protein
MLCYIFEDETIQHGYESTSTLPPTRETKEGIDCVQTALKTGLFLFFYCNSVI